MAIIRVFPIRSSLVVGGLGLETRLIRSAASYGYSQLVVCIHTTNHDTGTGNIPVLIDIT